MLIFDHPKSKQFPNPRIGVELCYELYMLMVIVIRFETFRHCRSLELCGAREETGLLVGVEFGVVGKEKKKLSSKEVLRNFLVQFGSIPFLGSFAKSRSSIYQAISHKETSTKIFGI